MRTNYLIVTVLMLISASLNAQWDTITSFNQDVSDIKSFDGKLFIGGNFTKNEGNTCYWSAYYNGFVTTNHTAMIGGTGIRSFDVFNNDLYAVGSMLHGFNTGVSKWDGSTWVNGGSTNYSHSTIYADNNDLYVVSDDGVIRKKTIGGYFQNFHVFNGNEDISSIIRYNNELFFAGSFDTIDGVAASNIAKWDGTNWTSVGSGVSTGVSCMAVYNNELYIAGTITSAGGTSVNSIAKWDGSNWTDVGGGITATGWYSIKDMTVFNGALYVVGDFTEMGSITTHDVAKWNGSQWSDVSLNHEDYAISCIEVYNNKLYVGTLDFYESHLFVYNGSGVNIADLNSSELNKFKIFPNPVMDKMNIEIESCNVDNINIEVIDILGNVLMNKDYETTKNANISVQCKQLPKGTYIILIREANSKSIIMQDKFIVH